MRKQPRPGIARSWVHEHVVAEEKKKRSSFLEADYASDYKSLPVRVSALTQFSIPVRGII